jgi:UDP-GlcNAc:undecaprenyl-phosphate/decaprenyl-phosphate GlcNAc-1-phosphate transferase
VTVTTIALAGAILGFLRYNFNPATIFLGDSGSLFIGFVLSALALEGAQKAPTIVAVAIPVVSFGLPYPRDFSLRHPPFDQRTSRLHRRP